MDDVYTVLFDSSVAEKILSLSADLGFRIVLRMTVDGEERIVEGRQITVEGWQAVAADEPGPA
jgi:hypothetical protein